MLKRIALLLPLLLFCSLPVLAQRPASLRSQELNSLRGIEKLSVMVESDVARQGYDEASIQRSVAARLDRAHVPASLPREGVTFQADVLVSLLAGPDGAVMVRVQVRQPATLDRVDMAFFCVTWERVRVVKGKIPDVLAAMVDEFADDYNEVN